MIGVYNHLLSKVFRFHYHAQKVIGSLGSGLVILNLKVIFRLVHVFRSQLSPSCKFSWFSWFSLPKTNSKSPKKWWFPSSESPGFQGAPIFRGELLVLGRVSTRLQRVISNFSTQVMWITRVRACRKRLKTKR